MRSRSATIRRIQGVHELSKIEDLKAAASA